MISVSGVSDAFFDIFMIRPDSNLSLTAVFTTFVFDSQPT